MEHSDPGRASPSFRYAAVLVLTLVLVVFLIVAPDGNLSRAIALALECTALVVVVRTSRAHGAGRRARGVAAVALLLVVGVATGVVPTDVVLLVGGVLAVTIPLALVGGLLRLVRSDGVNLQAVAGTLAIYLLVGVAFAWVIGFVARVETGTYFVQAGGESASTRVYYSFTVMTTTGFGDFTAAQPVGRALAVVEMLAGQLYLVTVIGLVVGNYIGRQRS